MWDVLGDGDGPALWNVVLGVGGLVVALVASAGVRGGLGGEASWAGINIGGCRALVLHAYNQSSRDELTGLSLGGSWVRTAISATIGLAARWLRIPLTAIRLAWLGWVPFSATAAWLGVELSTAIGLAAWSGTTIAASWRATWLAATVSAAIAVPDRGRVAEGWARGWVRVGDRAGGSRVALTAVRS